MAHSSCRCELPFEARKMILSNFFHFVSRANEKRVAHSKKSTKEKFNFYEDEMKLSNGKDFFMLQARRRMKLPFANKHNAKAIAKLSTEFHRLLHFLHCKAKRQSLFHKVFDFYSSAANIFLVIDEAF